MLCRVPFETADGIAKATGTSGITVGRYLRKLGFRNLEDAKASLRELPVVAYQPWGMNERLDSWHQQRSLPDRAQQSLLLEIDAITYVYQLAQGETFLRIARRVGACGSRVYPRDPVHPAGSLTPFSVTWNTCGLKSATPKGFPADWVESLNIRIHPALRGDHRYARLFRYLATILPRCHRTLHSAGVNHRCVVPVGPETIPLTYFR